jgi:hypothetical protein
VASEEPLYLQLDEGGFRRILLRLARWVSQRMARPPKVKLSVRATSLPGTSEPAVAIVFEFNMTSPENSVPDVGAQEYGGAVTVHRLEAPVGVETALLLPRVRLSSEVL